MKLIAIHVSSIILFLLGITFNSHSQTIPSDHQVDWSSVGLSRATNHAFTVIDMAALGAIGDGVTPNDTQITQALSNISETGTILEFPEGNFLFTQTIDLPDFVILKGQGAENTTFSMDLGGSGHGINIEGDIDTEISTHLLQSGYKNSTLINVMDASPFEIGDWIYIRMEDTDLVTSDWAENSIGQIVTIENIINNLIVISSPLRLHFGFEKTPYIQKINPAKNVGIECLKIKRIDNTAPEQASNIHFETAVNCWVSGIESEDCTFSHIDARTSSNLHISKSYFHHGFEYGGNGRAYGVTLHFSTNECLIENNIFEHLRHSMLLQAGANGNVFSYNYSFDPFWTNPNSQLPEDAAGDVVLHGNYPFSNLFEQNICRNIVVDNSHGANGPNNTFFRNRAEGFGIFFSDTNSPNQVFIGNEITNTIIPYSLANYFIQGEGHFLHGNNNKGTIHPPNTTELPETSLVYEEQQEFIPAQQWAAIGTPNNMEAAINPAQERYLFNSIFDGECENLAVNISEINVPQSRLSLFPNPTKDVFTIESKSEIEQIMVFNNLGQKLYFSEEIVLPFQVNSKTWQAGLHFVFVRFSNGELEMKKVIK